MGCVDKDTEDQAINNINEAMDISLVLEIKSWLIIYAKSCINVAHNSTAPERVLKTSCEMNQNEATFTNFLIAAPVVYLCFVVTES